MQDSAGCWRRRRGGRSRSSRRHRPRARARAAEQGQREARAAGPTRVDQHRALGLRVGDLVLHPRHRDLDLFAAGLRVVQGGGDEPALGPARQRRAAAGAPDDGRWLVVGRGLGHGCSGSQGSDGEDGGHSGQRDATHFSPLPRDGRRARLSSVSAGDNHPDGRSSVTMGACSREGSRDRLTAVDLLPGVRSSLVDTDRIRMRVLEAGPADGVPVVSCTATSRPPASTSTSCPALPPGLPGDRARTCAASATPSPRRSTPPAGSRDWADDTAALLARSDHAAPPHLVGWSTGGAAIAALRAGRGRSRR